MKLLLYCTKKKMKLRKSIIDKCYYLDNGSEFNIIPSEDYKINGYIVAECDFKVEEIIPEKYWHSTEDYDYIYNTGTVYYEDLLKKSCLMDSELEDYLYSNDGKGYAIHIKKIHIFDKPRKIESVNSAPDYFYFLTDNPSRLMYVYDCIGCETEYSEQLDIEYISKYNYDKKVLLPVKPEELYRILNGEQTIIVKKKVLKEML